MKEQAKVELRTEQGEVFEIPEGGSLGLLALGYTGLMLWREKRQEIRQERATRQSDVDSAE